ncbi:uncharacterized protein FJT64_019333 [Amphibalanus amphitrite]|uniref:Integrase catalytic domain-containing protein n=1 Tax=Amphibalanus amphitrite TaxID=1232801 RepID=A0A6A4WQ13_AMPAM|nr:uncharacterized protein FJT64_019333 [Amphibalanus amphitrite]
MDNSATSAEPAQDGNVNECVALVQSQQQMLMTLLQEQQRLQSELVRQNQEMRQQQQQQQTSRASVRNVPSSSLSSKATYDMSMQQWRIWRRDIVQFAEMCGWDVKTTVMNIRLQCDEKLKRVIEAEFGDRWIELTADQALTAVESILRKASNPAREKEKFHKLNQQPGETGKAFVHRCEQQALECDMACPHCSKDLSEWCIRDRVLAGLHSDQLKIDLYQNIDKYQTLASLVEKIDIFEAASAGCSVLAHVDADGEPESSEPADDGEAAVAALKSAYKRGKSKSHQKAQVVADLFEVRGHRYMVYADRLTGWIKLDHLRSFASNIIIPILQRHFSQYGVPEQISIDGGTSLVSAEMTGFFRRWQVDVRQSSAQYPQSNGRAEAAVKSAKSIMRNNTGDDGSLEMEKIASALLQYHNTPLREGDKSPAQLLMGRQLRGGVPVPATLLRVQDHWREDLARRERMIGSEG